MKINILDYTASQSSCSAVYGDTEIYNFNIYGNWAYNEEEETLTVIEFSYENLISNEVETYEDGNLYLPKAKVSFEGGQLVIIPDYEDGEDLISFYFNKK
ncbi:hypothetical protein N9V96_01605 [Polaribacter sp.]|nr:hypothetical protein [Polaribacter sp.]